MTLSSIRNFGITFLTGLMGITSSGCEYQKNTPVKTAPAPNQTAVHQTLAVESTTQTPMVNTDTMQNPIATQVANDVAQRLETSYARVAANQNDVCPKLLEFKYISQSLVRHNERLKQNSCEYYVYLNSNERLRVSTSNNVVAELIEPTWFDFRNGDFKAPTFNRYVIKLSYNGTRYNPQNLVYDVVVTKNPTENAIQ